MTSKIYVQKNVKIPTNDSRDLINKYVNLSYNPFLQKKPLETMKNLCQNCQYFDNSRHLKDKRTEHAGMCLKWVEVTFKSDHCKQFEEKTNDLPVLLDLSKLPPVTQLNLFQ